MIADRGIVDFPEVRLIGMCVRTSFVNDRTSEVWRGFRTVISTVRGRIDTDSYSVKVYGSQYSFTSFDPASEFEKWAAVRVSADALVPDGLESLTIPAGHYAEFLHVGPASAASKIFPDILGRLIPEAGFEIDLRPHFEILPEGYDPFDYGSTERVLIPVRPRA